MSQAATPGKPVVYLRDYRPPAWWIDTTDLDFVIDHSGTTVTACLAITRNTDQPSQPLILDGEELETLSVSVNGQSATFSSTPTTLTLDELPDVFILKTVVRIAPDSNTRLSGMMGRALAPTGAIFAFLSLWTGALWGKPMWGAWWVWDARLTSELILFFLYLGYIALTSAIDDPRRADKAGGILALVGALNVPVIYFSVKWWNTLHQDASVSLTKGFSMAQTMLEAM